jgi:hypothetical protein
MSQWLVLVHHAARARPYRQGEEDTMLAALSSFHTDASVYSMMREPQDAFQEGSTQCRAQAAPVPSRLGAFLRGVATKRMAIYRKGG